MAEPIYVARATVDNVGSLHRRAEVATGASANMGVHGPIQRHYALSPPCELPLPVDWIVAATGG